MNCCESNATRRAKRVQLILLVTVVGVLAVVGLVREAPDAPHDQSAMTGSGDFGAGDAPVSSASCAQWNTPAGLFE